MAVTTDTLRIQSQIRAAVAHITDQQTREFVRSWAIAWDSIEPELTATLLEMLTAGDQVTRAPLLRSERLKRVLVLIADRLDDLTTTARVRVVGDLRGVIDAVGGAQTSVIDSQLPRNARSVSDSRACPGRRRAYSWRYQASRGWYSAGMSLVSGSVLDPSRPG